MAQPRFHYQTTLRRALIACLAGPVTLWALTVAGWIVFMSVNVPALDSASAARLAFYSLESGMLFALVAAGAALAVTALIAPVWRVFDRRGVRGPWAGACAGGAAGAVVGLVLGVIGLMMAALPEEGPGTRLSLLLGFAINVTGATVGGVPFGLLAWRVAYRRVLGATDVAQVF